jgi:hypothetical protein
MNLPRLFLRLVPLFPLVVATSAAAAAAPVLSLLLLLVPAPGAGTGAGTPTGAGTGAVFLLLLIPTKKELLRTAECNKQECSFKKFVDIKGLPRLSKYHM